MNYWISLGLMALTTYAIRALPLTLFQKRVKSRFLQSFLYYVPVACLAAMTFPAILFATSHLWGGVAGLALALLGAALGFKLPAVAALGCGGALLVEGLFLVI